MKPLKDTSQWGLWAPVAVATGAMIYFSLKNEPPLEWLYIGLGVVTALFFIANFALRRLTVFYILALGLMCVCLGFSAGILRTSLLHHTILKQQITHPIMAHGTVELIEDMGRSGKRIILSKVDLWRYPKNETPDRIRIILRSKKMPEILPGDRIAVRISIGPPPRPVLPHGFDFARMMYFGDMSGATGFAYSTPYLLHRPEQETWIRKFNRALERHRYNITERIYHALEQNYEPSVVGITAAMITSEAGRITTADMISLRASGLAHILSISGLHMVLASSILFVGMRMLLALIPPIALRYPIKKWSAAAAIIMSFYYLLISGMPVPAERSYIMLALFFLAIIFDRTNMPMRPIALSAGLLILLKPESILDPSFQMSYAAVIGLCAYFQKPGMNSHPLKQNIIYKMLYSLWSVAMASVVAGIATAPFAFYHFGQYAVYGLFANMAVMPLTSFVIMPAGVLAMLLMPFGLEHWSLALMAEGIRGMMWVSDQTVALPFSTLNLPHMNVVPLVLMVFGGLWICFWIGRIRWLGLIPVLIATCLYTTQHLPSVVVDERGKLFAIYDPDVGMLVPARTHARYARNYWMKALGVKEVVRFDELPENHPLATCTAEECSWQIDGVHFFRGEKCEPADVLILTAAKDCKGKELTITPLDLSTNGAHAIWVMGGKPRMETAELPRGHRPWTTH